MNEILKKIGLYGIVPVVKIDDVDKAVPLAKALCDGGLPVAEITFRTKCAAEAIKRITTEFPQMLVGAGTVLTTDQADEAVAAGAKFIVSPGLNPKVVAHCQKIGVPITPGCSNPSDIEAALELGLDVVKFFPAEAAGGLPMIKAMSAPYGNLKFMPTGGLNESNILDYLKFNKILACGGSYM
ncbi:MAG: bifunctional 4-hydroxy-2-oxoglutarate aldolase/2-dehydro-3-deoxy-phosphogluconate aldolase, partial [Eubacteriales bacterium]|nr:bifunctional 4-hydroxy-2-oxoglutarate aldolase/2-dehydro-3-deoxy-phosphogluconate aldolase [Eubacteriales bacterium]